MIFLQRTACKASIRGSKYSTVLSAKTVFYNFREDAPELLEGLMMVVCRVRMSLPRNVDFFFFILYLLSYVFNPNDWVFGLIPRH